MSAFVTGGTGFIGRRLVRRLLERDNEPVYVLVYQPTPELVAALKEFWGAGAERVTMIEGDISRPDLGVSAKDARKLKGKIDHFFHLAAVYDLKAPPAQVVDRQCRGRRQRARLRQGGQGGLLPSRELDRRGRPVRRRVPRGHVRGGARPRASVLLLQAQGRGPGAGGEGRSPGGSIGRASSSAIPRTGEIDKIDGPYYFFKLIQKLRDAVPSWVPMIGIEGGRINVVPVDFVVAAIDHLAHLDGLDGRTFHLTDPNPMRVGDMLNALAKAAHAPPFTVRVNAGLFGFAPAGAEARPDGADPVPPHAQDDDEGARPAGRRLHVRQLSDPLRQPRDAEAPAVRPGSRFPPSRTTPGGSGTIGSAISIRRCSSTGRCAARSKASAFS